MPELPRISGKEAVREFERLGFRQVRQKGSHVVLRRDDRGCVIPLHSSLALGTRRTRFGKLESALKNSSKRMREMIVWIRAHGGERDVLFR